MCAITEVFDLFFFNQLKFWHIEKTVSKVDPILHVEVMDKDVFSKDDKLGKLNVNRKFDQNEFRCDDVQHSLK